MTDNLIRDPGKFEGEPTYAPHFHDLTLDGGADAEEFDGETIVAMFSVSPQDRATFPYIDATTDVIAVWEDSQGFVHTREWAQWEADAFVRECQEAGEEPDDEADWI